MSKIIKNAMDNIDPKAKQRVDKMIKEGSESLYLFDVSDSVFCFDRAAGVSTCKKVCEWCSKNQDFEKNER